MGTERTTVSPSHSIYSLCELIVFSPQTPQELFNLRHSSLRNVVERIFGVAKRRFRLMVAAPEYSPEVQAKVIPALCALHNFIRIHDPDDLDDQDWQEEIERQYPSPGVDDLRGRIDRAERSRAVARREKISNDMWADYVLRDTPC